MTTIETRNATLADLATLLKQQHEDKADAVVFAEKIRSRNGVLQIEGMGYEALAGINPNARGDFRPTAIMDGHIADKLGIPVQYLRKLRETRPDLYDANVNGWLQGTADIEPGTQALGYHGPDPRKFLVRTFADLAGGEGIGRALLSDSYKPVDHLDVLTAALKGVKESGTEIEVVSADLTETRMVVKIAAPALAVAAPQLLGGYRSPVDGFSNWDLDRLAQSHTAQHLGWDRSKGEYPPVVFAGFEISNSETGGGAFGITPRIVVLACKNGLKVTRDIMRQVHLGAKLGEGRVRWSDATYQKNLELVAQMATDAVKTFLDIDYVASVVADLEAKAGKELSDPAKTIQLVGKELKFGEETTNLVLDHFIKGAQPTAGGVLQAVTSVAQIVESAELAYELENAAVQALELAYAAA